MPKPRRTGPGTGNQRRAWIRKPRTKPDPQPAPGKPMPVPPKIHTPESLSSLRPRERLDAIHAMQALLDFRVRQGQLVEADAVETGHAEMREVIRNDLIGTLPLRLASELSGRTFTPQEVRAIVLTAVRDTIRSWGKGGVPIPEGET